MLAGQWLVPCGDDIVRRRWAAGAASGIHIPDVPNACAARMRKCARRPPSGMISPAGTMSPPGMIRLAWANRRLVRCGYSFPKKNEGGTSEGRMRESGSGRGIFSRRDAGATPARMKMGGGGVEHTERHGRRQFGRALLLVVQITELEGTECKVFAVRFGSEIGAAPCKRARWTNL